MDPPNGKRAWSNLRGDGQNPRTDKFKTEFFASQPSFPQQAARNAEKNNLAGTHRVGDGLRYENDNAWFGAIGIRGHSARNRPNGTGPPGTQAHGQAGGHADQAGQNDPGGNPPQGPGHHPAGPDKGRIYLRFSRRERHRHGEGPKNRKVGSSGFSSGQ